MRLNQGLTTQDLFQQTDTITAKIGVGTLKASFGGTQANHATSPNQPKVKQQQFK